MPPTMNKEQLLVRLLSLRAAVVYDIFGQICVHEYTRASVRGEVDLGEIKQVLPEGEVSLQHFLDQLNAIDNLAARETKRNANRFVTRNYLKELFRLVQFYCNDSGQYELLKEQDWYHFARVLVNYSSHGSVFYPEPGDRKRLPLHFQDVSITEKDVGSEVSLTLQTILDLAEALLDFCKKDLA